MTSGLPTFATCHGGPAEIIEHGISGFHVDPHHPDQAAAVLADFLEQCREDPSYWERISNAGLQRIYERFVLCTYRLTNTYILAHVIMIGPSQLSVSLVTCFFSP